MKIAEIILANKKILIADNNLDRNIDRDEINLFKAFLIINETINKGTDLTLESTVKNIDKIAELMISLKFSTSDIGIFDDVNQELLKLAYTTSYKFEKLIEFLNGNEENNFLIADLCKYFKQESIEELKKQVDYLIVQILLFRQNESYKFKVEDTKTEAFLDSLISDKIIEVEDFLNLRNFPLYKIENGIYAIINAFFVLDKFTTSIFFHLKDCYNKKHKKKKDDRTFFHFFNTEFSEKYLMKNLLDNIFSKKYQIKHEVLDTDKNEPDYYVRHNKDIYIFEYKTVLIAKDVKVSVNANKILKALEGKFLTNPNDGTRIGIGQILTHIEAISEYNFIYDTQIEKKKNYNFFPILLLSNRMLEIPGINHILNNWFKNNLSINNKNFNIKNLTVIDIDTLIFFEQHLKQSDKYFKNYLEEHIDKMNMSIKGYGNNLSDFENSIIKKITKKLSPFSSRFNVQDFDQKLFTDRFSYLVKD